MLALPCCARHRCKGVCLAGADPAEASAHLWGDGDPCLRVAGRVLPWGTSLRVWGCWL